MDAVRLRAPMGDVLVLDALRASAAERRAALPAARGASLLRACCAGSTEARAIASLYALAYDHALATTRAGASRELLLRRVEEAVSSGRLLVIELRPRLAVARPT